MLDFKAELAWYSAEVRALSAEYDNEVRWCMHVGADPTGVATIFIHPESEC